jgi:RNA polymerase sigma-70 factor, ECF subfamily
LTFRKSNEEFAQRLAENELIIHKICRLYGRTDEDRKDLFQEIVIQAWQGYEKFKGDSKFSTWLYRVAINTAISGVRKTKRSIPLVNVEMIPDVPNTGPSEEEQLHLLTRAIERLNPVEKALVTLYLEEKTYQEMELIIGISKGALRVKMTRIKEKLRSLLNQ